MSQEHDHQGTASRRKRTRPDNRPHSGEPYAQLIVVAEDDEWPQLIYLQSVNLEPGVHNLYLSKQDAEPEWIDDPHDIEQGMMRNPNYRADSRTDDHWPEHLSNFREGQWWVKELDELHSSPEVTDDQRRAIAVVHHLLASLKEFLLPRTHHLSYSISDDLRFVKKGLLFVGISEDRDGNEIHLFRETRVTTKLPTED